MRQVTPKSSATLRYRVVEKKTMLSAINRKLFIKFGVGTCCALLALSAGVPAAFAHMRLARFTTSVAPPDENLTSAVSDHDTTRVSADLRSGIRPDHRLIGGHTLLEVAMPTVTVCRLLIDAGVDVNQRDASGGTVLMTAAARHDVIAMRMLLDHGADPNARSTAGLTPLSLACGTDHPSSVALLLSSGARPNQRMACGRTVLTNVLDHPALVKLLLDNGANPNVRYSEPGVPSTTPLIDASATDQPITSELLIAHGADVNAVDSRGETPLIMAAQGSDVDLVRMLMSRHADTHIVDRSGSTAITWAKYDGNRRMISVLTHARQRFVRS